MAITKKQIEKWNSYFKSLSKAEKRVAIAKDILLQLKKGRYYPIQETYIDYLQIEGRYNAPNQTNIQENFDNIQCECCQLGACLMSLIKFENEVTVSDLDRVHLNTKVWKRLAKYFTPYQLLLMECSFEGGGGLEIDESRRIGKMLGATLSASDDSKCIEFYKSYSTSKDRMTAICKNIIKNKGTFKL